MTVFLDSYAIIAWLNPRDQDSARVNAYLSTNTDPILTTEWVLMEVADAFSSSKMRGTVIRLIQSIRADPQLKVIWYDKSIYQAGFNLFASRPDKDWSLTDCISFAVMTQHKVTDALTADHHFEQAGFRALFA